MTEQAVRKAESKAHLLDAETQKTLRAIKSKNSKSIIAFIICWSILLIVGGFTLWKQSQLINKQNQAIALQNQIAQANKDHIDCIIKLFVTPSKPGQTRHIVALDTCQIKVN